MPRGSQWTVDENEMALEPVFAWLGPLPWDQVPPTPQVGEWARNLHEREPRHSVSSWDAKIRDVLSCLPILTVRSYDGRPAGSVRRIKDGAKGPTVEGPSTRELVALRIAAMRAPGTLEGSMVSADRPGILPEYRETSGRGRGEGGIFGVNETQEIEVPVEYDSLGMSTGVEAEEQTPEPLIYDPFDPAEIDVITRTMTVDLLLARIRRGVLDLAPDFQRFAGIWSDIAQSKLIESLLLRIPLPTLYAAESGEESWVVVDGIQRLTAIARFVEPSIVGASPLRLHGMEYLRAYEGHNYGQLPRALQTRIDETELIVHLIRAGTPEPVKFNIFARLNTGGTPLTLQELRHALIPGRARDLLKELADGEPFRDATQGSVRPERMADREMVLRFLAFRLTEPADYPRGDLDDFLRQAMKRLNDLPEHFVEQLSSEFAMSMRGAAAIFGQHAFRKVFAGQRGRLPVNKALFEAESVGLARLSGDGRARLRERHDEVLIRLAELMADPPFLQSISVGTGDAEKVRLRFSAMERMLREVTGD
jgi:Protein of unknown function DUF262